jgi:hypothetical protein
MTKLTSPQARLLKALHDNGGSIRWLATRRSETIVGNNLEKMGLCLWTGLGNARKLEITPKGIEALKGPIE